MGYSAMCHEAIPISLPAPRQDQWARHVITVEPEFWEQFRLMTMERQTTIGKLLAEIDRIMRLLPYQGPGRHRVRTLSAAVRVFVLQMLISRSSGGARRARVRSPRSPWSLPRGMHPSRAVRIVSAP
jgi:predicted DNA-binding ribbon-helix-helix protein